MKKLALVVITAMVACVHAQDVHFVNNQNSLIYLNPSYAGSNGGVRNLVNYRNQWPNLSGSFVTFFNSTDVYIKPIKGGVSLNLFSDDQARGTLRTTAISLAYAQHFSLLDNKLKIIPSVQFGYFKKSLDRSRLNFGDPINANGTVVWTNQNIVPKASVSNYDISAGLLFNYMNTYFGASVFHINQPDEGLMGYSKLPYRLNLHASHNFVINENVLLHLYTQLTQQASFNLLKFQANALLYNRLIASVGYTNNSAYIFGLGYRHNYFTILLNYDQIFSELSGNTANSWEFSASFNLRNKENRKTVTNFERW